MVPKSPHTLQICVSLHRKIESGHRSGAARAGPIGRGGRGHFVTKRYAPYRRSPVSRATVSWSTISREGRVGGVARSRRVLPRRCGRSYHGSAVFRAY